MPKASKKRIAYCIYCHDKEALSGEHYLPACLGKFLNFRLLRDKLCSDCNRKLGQLEEQFCRCGPEAFFRIVVGVKGRKHHNTVNPFYRGSAGAKPIMIESQHPKLNCSFFCEIEKGGKTGHPAKQIVVRDSAGNHHSILITEKIETPDDLLRELRNRGLENSTFVECWASDEEREQMEMLCQVARIGISWSEMSPFEQLPKMRFVSTITVNSTYFRAIAKIVFHYFLKHFTQFTGFEKEFEGIKEFIMKGNGSDRFVKEVPGSFVYGLGYGVTTDRWGHLLAVDKTEKSIRAMLHFFVGPGIAPSRYYEVYIGNNPQRIIYPQAIGHQFVYFDEPDRQGYCGRVDPLFTISRGLLT